MAATTTVAPPKRRGVACGAPARHQAVPEADRSKEERLQAVDPGRTGHWNRPPRDPTEAVGCRPSVAAPSSWSAHRTRLLAGIASPAGVEMARAHGVEPGRGRGSA